MNLVLAEKPSVAKNIAKILGANEKQDGFYKSNDYYITFVFGHLFTLYDAKDYNPKYQSWDVENLPVIPGEFKYKLIDDPGVKKQFKTIEKLIKDSKVNCIINACDSDREGSLIFAEVYQAVGIKKPVKRLWISSHGEEEITKGFENIKTGEEDQPLTLAGFTRQWVDWLFGINLTVATTKLYSKDKTVLKVGRVILPTINLIYQKDMEIKNFVSKKYFELVGTFETETGSYEGIYFNEDKSKFEKKEALESILSRVKNQAGVITSVKIERKIQSPPRFFNLTDLQGYITKKYDNFSADKVLKICQGLYEPPKALITYPRTASKHLDNSQTKEVEKVLHIMNKNFFPDLSIAFSENKNIFDSSKVDSHPALIPTGKIPKIEELTPDEKIIYMEIVKRFCAGFSSAAEYEQTEAITNVSEHCFKTKGKTLVFPGWIAIYGGHPEEDDEEPELKIKLKEQMKVKNIKLETKEKETKPPAHYTVQTLLSAMQTCGKSVEDETEILKGYQIGTPATRAEILKKIEKIGYVQVKGKSFYITSMGTALMELFPLKEMLEPDFTGRLEKRLKDIEKNIFQPKEYLDMVNKIIINGISQMKNTQGVIVNEKTIIGKCPECGKDIIENQRGFPCSGYKETGCKFMIWKKDLLLAKYGKSVSTKMAKDFLSKKVSKVKGLINPLNKSKHDGEIHFAKNDKGYWSYRIKYL